MRARRFSGSCSSTSSRPDFQYRHVWADGDLVAWDNHLTQHYAASDFTERRVVHRVGFHGTPFPASV